jgi:hypothetical protein
MYPLHEPGEIIQSVHCKLHNFNWDKFGNPLNNDKSLICGKAEVGASNLIIKDFIEPDHKWVICRMKRHSSIVIFVQVRVMVVGFG